MSLRRQLLLVSVVVLVLPLAGWQFVREMEQFLRASQERALIATARSIAVQLAEDFPQGSTNSALYVRRIDYPVTLDGYADDWALWLPWGQGFGRANHAPVTVLLAEDDEFVYLLFQVIDETREYSSPNQAIYRADHIVVTLDRPAGPLRFEIATAAPGTFEARPVNHTSALRLRGGWRETSDGYSVELRFPARAMDKGMGFAVWDGGATEASLLAGTGARRSPSAPVPLVTTVPVLNRRLASLLPERNSAWLVNASGWLLARHGETRDAAGAGSGASSQGWGALAYRLLLAPPLGEPRIRPDIAVRLDSDEVRSALAGTAAVRWQAAPIKNSVVASAAVPVRVNDTIVGAVVLEQASDALLLFTNSALLRLVGLTLVVFAAAALMLLGFASVLSWRVLKLRDATERSITADGRVQRVFPTPRAKDEIGDLGRSFARVLDELKGHTDYLRTLADKLSHEIRTPLAMVRSSLDNLEQESLTAAAADYARRAREGAERLSEILRAMGEAARMEQSIQHAELESFDLAELVTHGVVNWQALLPERRLEYRPPTQAMPIHGAPELLARLLDKLLENAADFTPARGRIVVQVTRADDAYRLAVTNEGPPLPDGADRRLFESLVSVREGKGGGPHMGLGLYVARLIAEFHGGGIHAENVAGGVKFEVTLKC